MNQWSGQQQQPSNWSSTMSPRGGMYPNPNPNPNPHPLPPHTNQQSHQKTETKRPGAGAGKSNVEMQPEAYQRTLEYVQQCQSWSSSSVVSPDSTAAKQKSSPPHPAAPVTVQDNSSNMVIGDMTSSMNLLNEE